MREGEVAGAGDLLLKEVDAVDGEEVGVDVVLVVEDPEDLAEPVSEGVRPSVVVGPLAEAGQPRRAAFPSFSWVPRDLLTTIPTILSSCSFSKALDSSSAL